MRGEYTDCELMGEKGFSGTVIPEPLAESDELLDAGLEQVDSPFLSHELTDKNDGYDMFDFDLLEQDDEKVDNDDDDEDYDQMPGMGDSAVRSVNVPPGIDELAPIAVVPSHDEFIPITVAIGDNQFKKNP